MAKQSAGILLYRIKGELEVFLVHPGGPFFVKKDNGSWTIPKGELADSEDPLSAARREFKEETGMLIDGNFLALNPVKQKGGKTVFAWAVEGDMDPETLESNTFEIFWPPGSKVKKTFPEIDRGAWFNLHNAREKINAQQAALLDELFDILSADRLEN